MPALKYQERVHKSTKTSLCFHHDNCNYQMITLCFHNDNYNFQMISKLQCSLIYPQCRSQGSTRPSSFMDSFCYLGLSLTHSCCRYIVNTYFVLDTVQGCAENSTAISKAHSSLFLTQMPFRGGEAWLLLTPVFKNGRTTFINHIL